MTRRPDPLAVRLYRRALRILPGAFREIHGPAMVAMLADEWREKRGMQRVSLFAGALVDLAWTAMVERVRPPEGAGGAEGAGGGGRAGAGSVAARARGGPPVSWLDVKLGFRMLVRYPGLTLVGGLAMAFAICVGAATFEVLSQFVRPSLPLPGGERIVAVHHRDVEDAGRALLSLHDFEALREDFTSVEDLGAYRTVARNLIVGNGGGQPVQIAEISASAFPLTRARPLLGRTLVEADERPGAEPVAVIGEAVWESRFGRDPDVVGRTVGLGDTEVTVVGVMPADYRFPLSHDFWIPLRFDPLQYAEGEAPGARVFGRLAPGVELAEARAELSAVGARAAADAPWSHAGLRPEVLPYARSYLDVPPGLTVLIMSSNLLLVALLVLVCANVALLTFARAAARMDELVVRNALGAGRRRIVGQLFAEALVLGAVAALVGLGAAGRVLTWGLAMVKEELMNGNDYPFWIVPGLTADTVAYAAVLTVLAAVVAGVLPGLKVTGKGLASRLQAQSAGGGGPVMGGVWTAVIVGQVALTVFLPATAFLVAGSADAHRSFDPGFDDGAYLSARLELGPSGWERQVDPGSGVPASFPATLLELERRLEADPAVVDVTFADRLPRMYHPWNRIEVDEGAVPPPDSALGHRVFDAAVALDYFDALGARVIAGRSFHSGDLAADAPPVLVNRSFVEEVLGGRNPLGRRVRILDADYWNGDAPVPLEERPWLEIVGVVPDLGMSVGRSRQAGLYYPARPGDAPGIHVAVHTRSDPASFIPRLRALATDVDPTLRLYEAQPLAEADFGGSEAFLQFWFTLVVGVSTIATGLALTGIYAVMSFTVARRTREIGVRVALGADAARVVLGVFRRPLRQVGLGLLAGVALTGLLVVAWWGPSVVSPKGVGLLSAYAALTVAVCALACVVPTRRALRIEPTEALRDH